MVEKTKWQEWQEAQMKKKFGPRREYTLSGLKERDNYQAKEIERRDYREN